MAVPPSWINNGLRSPVRSLACSALFCHFAFHYGMTQDAGSYHGPAGTNFFDFLASKTVSQTNVCSLSITQFQVLYAENELRERYDKSLLFCTYHLTDVLSLLSTWHTESILGYKLQENKGSNITTVKQDFMLTGGMVRWRVMKIKEDEGLNPVTPSGVTGKGTHRSTSALVKGRTGSQRPPVYCVLRLRARSFHHCYATSTWNRPYTSYVPNKYLSINERILKKFKKQLNTERSDEILFC